MTLETRLVELALDEDLPYPDRTISWIEADRTWNGRVVVRQPGILCGSRYVTAVYRRIGDYCAPLRGEVELRWLTEEGEDFRGGQAVATIRGPAGLVLAGERTALNFLMRLSGLATEARKIRESLPPELILLDTRKTTPGWRMAEKEAFRLGGLVNHRLSLAQAVMLKDNHRPFLRPVPPPRGPLDALEVEIDHPDQLEDALALEPQALLLDNFSDEDLMRTVPRIPEQVAIELSGDLTPEYFLPRWQGWPEAVRKRIRYVSMGRTLQRAGWLDFSLEADV